MADSKKRFLLVPDDAWAEATLVSATSQDGLTVTQPDEDTALGDLRIVVSGEPTGEVSSSLSIQKAGTAFSDARFLFADGLEAEVVPDQVWLRSVAGFSSKRPDILTNSESVYAEPIGFYKHQDGQRVSLLYQRRFYVSWSDVTVPPGASGSPGVLAFTRQADSTWSVAPTFLLLQSVDSSSCLIQTRELPWALVVTVGMDRISTHLLRDDLSVEERARYLLPVTASRPYSVSGCALPSGRLLVAVATAAEALVYVSDDLGLSWEAQEVFRYGGGLLSAYNHIFIHEREGVAILTLTHVNATSGTVVTYPAAPTLAFPVAESDFVTRVYTSSSGEAWGGGMLCESLFSSVAAVDDPEGALLFIGNAYPNPYGWSTTQRREGHTLFYPQGPLSSPQDLLPNNAASSEKTTIVTHSEPGVSVFGMQIAPLSHKGDLLIAESRFVQSVSLGGSSPFVSLGNSGLRVHTLSERHNLLESPPFWRDWDKVDGQYDQLGRSQNLCWDAWCLPQNVWWQTSLAGAASRTLIDAEATTGYLEAKGGLGDVVFWEANDAVGLMPMAVNADGVYRMKGSHNASLRFCVRAEAGGSLLRDEAFVRMQLTARDVTVPATGGYTLDLSLRLEQSGADLAWLVYDNIAVASVGSGIILGAANKWLEFLLTTQDTTPNVDPPTVVGRLFYREVDATDEERIAFKDIRTHGYGPTFPLSTKYNIYLDFPPDFLRFGHQTCLQNFSFDWKSMYLSRGAKNDSEYPDTPTSASVAPARLAERSLVPDDVGYLADCSLPDNIFGNVLAGQGTGSRGSVVSATPSYFAQGLHIRANGRWLDNEADTARSITVSTEYSRGALNVLPTNPVLQEYRSAETDPANSGAEEVRLVFELPTELTGTAMALFGRNTPAIRIEMNSSDSWAAAPVDIQICSPYDPVVANNLEYGFLYSTDTASTGPVFTVQDNVVSMDSRSPWRKHQFRSQETGQKFFAVLYGGFSQTNVYEIVDNTENKLILNAPGGAYVSATDLVVFSDRVAFDLGALMSTAGVPLKYVRVTFLGCRWPTTEQQHHRLGALWFGSLFNLSEPDFEWQWSRVAESGNTRTDTPGGATYSKRNRQFRRIFTASKPTMQSARVSNGVDSPQEQIRGSWEEFINLTERLEIDGKRCALIWQGERAEAGSQVDPVQRTADPLELIACRMDSGGTLQNDAYTCQNMTLGSSGLTAVPRPRASIAQIQFREEF